MMLPKSSLSPFSISVEPTTDTTNTTTTPRTPNPTNRYPDMLIVSDDYILIVSVGQQGGGYAVRLGDSLTTSRRSSLTRRAAPICRPASPRSAMAHSTLCWAVSDSLSFPRRSRFFRAYSGSLARPRRTYRW